MNLPSSTVTNRIEVTFPVTLLANRLSDTSFYLSYLGLGHDLSEMYVIFFLRQTYVKISRSRYENRINFYVYV